MDQLVKLSDIQAGSLIAFADRKEEILRVISENPFLEVTKETEKIARERRTALKKSRTQVQNDLKLIKGELNGLKDSVEGLAEELINLVTPAEVLQQQAIDIYDEAIEAEKQEKKRIEAERIRMITSEIEVLKSSYLDLIIKAKNTDDIFEIESRIKILTLDPDFYQEYISQAEEAKAYILEKIHFKAAEIRNNERQERDGAVEFFYSVFGKNPDAWLSTSEIRKHAEDEKAKRDREREEEIERQRKETDELKAKLKKLEDEKRAQEEKEAAEKKILAELRTKAIHLGIELSGEESAELLRIRISDKHAQIQKEKDEAEAKRIAAEKEAAEKAETERQEAERVRLEQLKPVKERLINIIDSLTIMEHIVDMGNQDANVILNEFAAEVTDLKYKYLTYIEKL